MNIMLSRSQVRFGVVVASLVLVFASLTAGAQQKASNRGRKFKAAPVTARIEVTVLRDVNGKPIENAAVIFHGVGDKSNMELKTNEDGKTMIDVLPIGGTVRLQIIARGFQTFGDDYKVDQPTIGILIRMKRPGEQYSIYKDHHGAVQGGKAPDVAKPDDANVKPVAPEADKDAQASTSQGEPTAEPDQQPSPSQSQTK